MSNLHPWSLPIWLPEELNVHMDRNIMRVRAFETLMAEECLDLCWMQQAQKSSDIGSAVPKKWPCIDDDHFVA